MHFSVKIYLIGAAGIAVTSDTRDLQFWSSYLLPNYCMICYKNSTKRTKINKEAENYSFKKRFPSLVF